MHSDAPPSPPVNHVFVDFENLKTIDGDTLGRKNFTFHLILGPTNKTLPVEAVARMMENAQAVTLIRSPKSGKNAADFVSFENLRKSAKARPKKRATLVSHAKSSLGKNATDAEGEAVVAELLKAGKLKIDEKGAVEYRV